MKTCKLHPRWIVETRREFKDFLRMTVPLPPKRNGERVYELEYPEWLIMFISVLSVKAKVKSYAGIYKMAERYWKYISSDKKRKHKKKTQTVEISADKMMVKSKGPLWHKKQKEKGIMPKGLRGVDKQATWGKAMRMNGYMGMEHLCSLRMKFL